jgi:hypothetical protein
MELTTLIISYLAVGWLIANFEPLHWVIDYIFMRFESKFMQFVHASFGCWKCTSFWTALAISGNIYVAAITSMVAYLISQWTND